MAMFGGRTFDPASGAMSIGSSVNVPNQAFPVPQMPAAKPGFFGAGGPGRAIAGYIGDALLAASGHSPIYTPLTMQARQQDNMLNRELALAAYKADTRAPTEMQRDYEYLKGVDPTLANQFLRARANPMALMTDPATGAVGFYPRGGIPGMTIGGGDDLPTVTDEASYNAIAKGAQYRDPHGNVRTKS